MTEKMMRFQTLARLAGSAFAALSLTLIFVPELIYWLFAQEGSAATSFIAKRAGVLFLALSVLCFFAAGTSSPDVQKAVAISIGTGMFAMACLGLIEWSRGNAGIGIWLAIIVEIIFVLLFARVWSSHHSAVR